MAIQFKSQSDIGKSLTRSKMILCEFFEKWHYFSLELAVYNTVWWIGNYCHPLVELQFWAKDRITIYMDKYLNNSILPPPHTPTTSQNTTILNTIRSTLKNKQPREIVDNSNYKIWIFWWQGEKAMPDLVRGCFQQVKSTNDNVILVTQENIRQYSDIPDYIFRRVEQGEISFTHLSDILRVSLLAMHGGLWLDSTCWIPASIPDEVKSLRLISPRTKDQPKMPFWSDSRWCGWCSGTNLVQNPLFVFTRDFFYSFYKTRSRIPFYLFIDYVYDYAYRNIPEVKTMIDTMPENNINRNKLHFLLNEKWNKQEYSKICKNNWVFKLSYKSVWKKKTPKGEETYYGKLFSV